MKKPGGCFGFSSEGGSASGGEKLGVGFENIREKLKGDKKLLEAIKKKVMEVVK